MREMETAGNKLKIYCETSFWSYLVGGPHVGRRRLFAAWMSF